MLEVPIIGQTERLHRGVWGTLSRANFERYRAAFDDTDQSKLGPMFSWLASHLPKYPETLNLRCSVAPRDDRLRPVVHLAPDEEHPLALDQRMASASSAPSIL